MVPRPRSAPGCNPVGTYADRRAGRLSADDLARFLAKSSGKALLMTKLASVLTALAMATGVAACGSSGGQSSTGAQSPTTSASQPPARAGAQPSARTQKTQKMAARAQRVTSQLAADAGSLASGNSAAEKQARTRLGQLQSESRSLAQAASRQLAPGNPMRPLVIQAAQRAGSAANSLRHMNVNASTASVLRSMQSMLSSLSGSLGQARTSSPSSDTSKIASELQALQRLLKAQ